MDSSHTYDEEEDFEDAEEDIKPKARPKVLPLDLPKSLDDRRSPQNYVGETEMYDAWQGQAQYIANPISPLAFNLSIADEDQDRRFHEEAEDNDTRLMAMLAAQAAHREDGPDAGDEDAIVESKKIPDGEKRSLLQKSLHMAASNGDVQRVRRLLKGPARQYIDINAADEEGTAPLIYASCFGHQEVVSVLLEARATVDRQDRNQWTALMWAMTNRHKDITKILLDSGASPDVKSSSGRTAFDFAAPNSEMSDYLHENGYHIGDVGVGDDFYNSGFEQDRFEQELEENEMRRRMMMDSSRDLEVDLSSLGMDERPETPEEIEGQHEFVWDKCLYDQMFVFQEEHLDQILDVIITNMTPQRSPSQKPVPANIIFLSARYAHYHATHDLLAVLLVQAMDKINDKVERCQWDMTVLAFWMSNATLLLHYLKKDPGLQQVTNEFQAQLAELIHEIFILIIRDAERRMDKVLDAAMLEHETIPGFEDVHFANDWNIFRSKNKVSAPDPIGVRPPAGNRRAMPSPRNITSLLSSTLFVLDLYDVHSVITAQVLAQLYYWLGAELFNHILSRRKFLARTKAMQIRMNVSALEDWARNNNREPEHYENGSLTSSGETTVDAARKHLTPVIQLLQWLQCFSSIGDDPEALENTLKQMTRLTPRQLLHSTNNYRYEVGEKTLPKAARKRLQALQTETRKRQEEIKRNRDSADLQSFNKPAPPAAPAASAPTSAATNTTTTKQDPPSTPHQQQQQPPPPQQAQAESSASPSTTTTTTTATTTPNGVGIDLLDDEDYDNEQLLMEPAHMLQFGLPTSVDLRLSYGAGYGGLNKERERKYIPTVPPEFLSKLDTNGGSSGVDRAAWQGGGDGDD